MPNRKKPASEQLTKHVQFKITTSAYTLLEKLTVEHNKETAAALAGVKLESRSPAAFARIIVLRALNEDQKRKRDNEARRDRRAAQLNKGEPISGAQKTARK